MQIKGQSSHGTPLKSELRHVRWLDESAVRLHLTMQALLRSSSCPYSVNGIDEAVRGAALV